MTQRFCKFLLEKWGWTLIGEPAPEKNCVYLEAPHTSIWDFVLGLMYYRAKGTGHLRTMIKKEAFFFPVNFLLRAMGAFPIDRTSPSKTILSIVHEMEASGDKPFHLVICPEGTRKAVRKWKTGYHTIVSQTGAALYITMIDWGHKRIGILQKFEIGDNAREDTDRIQQIYEKWQPIGLHPDQFLTR